MTLLTTNMYLKAILGSCLLFLTQALIAENLDQKSIKQHHLKNGVTCALCHAVKNPKRPAESKNCSWCHGNSELMIFATEHIEPNPHDSPHWGSDLACQECHKEHEESVNHCFSCHDDHFEFNVP